MLSAWNPQYGPHLDQVHLEKLAAPYKILKNHVYPSLKFFSDRVHVKCILTI